MASYNAKIVLDATIDKALRAVQKVEAAVNKIKTTVIDVKVRGVERVEEKVNAVKRGLNAAEKSLRNLAIFAQAFSKSFIAGPAEELARALVAVNKETELILRDTRGYISILKEAAKQEQYILELQRRNNISRRAGKNTLANVEGLLGRLRRAQDNLVQGSRVQERVASKINELEEVRNEIYKRRENQLL